MLPYHPGIWPNLPFSQEAVGQTIGHCIKAYEINSCGRWVSFGLKNLYGITADAIACISFEIFRSLYHAGCNKNSNISLQVQQGYRLEPDRGRLMGDIYSLQVQRDVAVSEKGISHAYALVNQDNNTGCLCFFLEGAVDVETLDNIFLQRFLRQNAQPQSISIIQRIISFILSLNCFR